MRGLGQRLRVDGEQLRSRQSGGRDPELQRVHEPDARAHLARRTPYYSINVNAPDNSWTAKFVVTAANAWDTAQESWLETTMAQPTTYTFVVRHESSDATPPLPPGVAGVDAVLAKYPYTLLLVGHTHNYGHWCAPRDGGLRKRRRAALEQPYDYGYGLFSQRCDGAIVVDEYDYQSGATDGYFRFVVTPTGVQTH